MKKLALSVAVSSIALAAVAAQAGTVYDEDGLALDISGQIAFEAKSGKDSDENSFSTDDLDLYFEPSYTMESGTVYGYFNLESKGSSDTTLEANGDEYQGSTDSLLAVNDDDYYIGFATGAFDVKYGSVAPASDEFGIDNAMDADTAYSLKDSGTDETVKVSYSADAFAVVASFDFADGDDDTTAYAVFGSYDVAGATLAATYESYEDAETAYGVSVAYSIEAIGLGASYTAETEVEEVSGIDLTASYDVTSEVSVAAGYGIYAGATSADDYAEYYVNASYDLGPLDFYGEVYGDDVADNLGYVMGIDFDF